MTLKTLLQVVRLLVAVVTLLSPGLATASSGYLRGTLRFHQKNGGYCATGATCTGARYPQTNWDVQVGIPEAIVRLEKTDGSLIAATVTDSAGNYALAWSLDTNGPSAGLGTADVSASLELVYYHKDGAYQYRSFSMTGSHTQYVSTTPVTLENGKTQATPQTFHKVWGTSANPGQIANSYWAAYMVYAYVLDDLARFTNVDIQAFEPTGPATPQCKSSCAYGYPVNVSDPAGRLPFQDQRLTVVLDGNPATAYQPLDRTMHELGHIGDFVSMQGGHYRHTLYDYTGPANDPNWGYADQEYRPTALTEGFGSFAAMAALYTDGATDPRTCFTNGSSSLSNERHCYATNSQAVFKVEESHLGSCATGEGRLPISALRFLWDVYDDVVDGNDDVDFSSTTILTTQTKFPCPSYPACYQDGQLHDSSSLVDSTSLGVTAGRTLSATASELDDGNAWHWRSALVASGGADSQNAFTQNCMGYH